MMTKLWIVLFAWMIAYPVVADEKSYTEAMTAALEQMKSTSPADYGLISNQFERIAQAEKTQWLPYYYAGFCNIVQSFATPDKTKADAILDNAEKMVNQALALMPDESENMVLKGFLACARIVVDPQTRGAQYSQEAIGSFRKAQELNSNNPRADYMMGMVLMNTPDFYGGGKKVAQPILEGAIRKFEKFVPLSPLHPVWGKEDCQKQLDTCKQNG